MKIPKFNPGFQTDEEAISSFVVRRQELQAILDGLADQRQPLTPRFLVTAPRGAGKTTLCRRVIAEVRTDGQLRRRWQPVLLGEESYAVTTPGEFLLEVVLQLNDQLGDNSLEAAYERALLSRSEVELASTCRELLEGWVRHNDRRLLIVVENIHMILSDQMQGGAKDAKALLQLLADASLFGVLATAVTLPTGESIVADLASYTQIGLSPLTLVECRDLWQALTEAEVSTARIRPLQILTGGSPRLLHILADFMRTPSLSDLMENLNFLIDQNTEYFKSQLDALPAIERKVFVSLLEIWDPSSAKQIAEAARVTTNIASAMLSRLVDRGAVMKFAVQGRTAIYSASERLFNIYYLMRRRSHPSSRVKALVAFMIGYYDQKELVDTTTLLAREACGLEPSRRSDYHSTFDAILRNSDEAVRAEILRSTPSEFIQSFRDDQRKSREHAAGASASNSEMRLDELIEMIETAADDGDFERARSLILEAIELNPSMAELWTRLAFVDQELSRPEDAMRAAEKARSLDPSDPWTHSVLAIALERGERTGEAEIAFRAALEIDRGHEPALTSLGSMLEARGEPSEALKLYEAAEGAGLLTDVTRASFGQLLIRMERFDRAEEVLRQGADDFENTISRHALVEFLDTHGREDEGVRLLENVAQRENRWETFADLGSYFLARTSNGPAARDAIRTAIDMGANRPILYSRLASAMKAAGDPVDQISAVADQLSAKYPEDARAWTLAGLIYDDLDSATQAEAAYRAALDHEQGDLALIPLARLLQRLPNRETEAEPLLRQAVSQARGRYKCGPSKELAELLIHNGDEDHAEVVLADAIEANNRCTCCLVLQGGVCSRRGDNQSAEQFYRRALQIFDEDVDAMTGLIPLVVKNEASELITRALEVAPDDPKALLARVRFEISELDKQIEEAHGIVELEPTFVEGRLFLARLLGKKGDLDMAVEQLELSLDLVAKQRELIPQFVSAAMAVAELGGGGAISDMLVAHQDSFAVEPLVVALQLSRGERPLVANEVMEVAKDIVLRATIGRS